MQYIEEHLKKLERLEPIPTGEKPRLKKGLDIRAFIFDIYGTLLISSSGDVNEAEISPEHFKSALEASNIEITTNGGLNEKERLEMILQSFVDSINQYHKENNKNNILYPEINVLGIWEDVITRAVRKKWLAIHKDSDIKYMTFIFEILSNRVYPMPGMKKVIKELSERDKILGIVSNSQFYTPMLMNFFLDNDVLNSEEIKPFDPDLTVYSFKMLKAKPEMALFTRIIPVLREKYGIEPHQGLFIGNDMFNDIYPAGQSGFKTALFAGDKRSLRLRKDKKELAGLSPDMVITDLNQLIELIQA